MKNKKIFIDPGHGGKDPGAVGPSGVKESEIALEVAKLLEEMIVSRGGSATLSRTGDSYVSITDRINMANSSKADVFVSIHCNSAATIASGTETWYSSKSSKGPHLAKHIQEEIISSTKGKNRGIKSDSTNSRFKDGIPVLSKTSMPAVLVEIEFINNPEIEKLMITQSWKTSVANSIYQGIYKYFNV